MIAIVFGSTTDRQNYLHDADEEFIIWYPLAFGKRGSDVRNERSYKNTVFSADTVRSAWEKLRSFEPNKAPSLYFSVGTGDSSWNLDDIEEFFAEYRKGPEKVYFDSSVANLKLKLSIHGARDTLIEVGAPDRGKIESIFAIFESAVSASKVSIPPEPPNPAPVIFIGHGHSPLWLTLKDHLREQHDYEVVAYETGARSGHEVRDILSKLAAQASFALLVLTAEDEHVDGSMHARENVIHETGLFQGCLGFHRAIILLEDGASEFSNINGIQQIRFSKDNIKETFGDVLATLRREFGTLR
jgi:hypothetical protein